MKRGLAWLAGALGLAALLRLRGRSTGTFERRDSDPADELRARLEQARDAPDDRDEFDAAEGQPVNEVGQPREQPRSIEERRRAIHEQAQHVLDEMQPPDPRE
jgi:hypothetical protein